MKKLLSARNWPPACRRAHAQHAGDNVAVLGWFHVMPQDSSTPLTTTSRRRRSIRRCVCRSFTSAGTGLSTKSADTFGLVFRHYFTDHIAVTTVAACRRCSKSMATARSSRRDRQARSASRTWRSQTNPIVKSVRQWSPALIFQYYFNAPTAKFRPFAGIGVSYNWFTDIKLSTNFVHVDAE